MIAPGAPDNPFREACEERAEEALRLVRRVRWFSWARLAVVGLALIMAMGAWDGGWIPLWTLLIPIVVFVTLARIHDRLLRLADETRRAAAWHRRAALRVYRDTLGLGGEPGDPKDAIRGTAPPTPRPTMKRDARLANRRYRLRRLGDTRLADHLDLFGEGQLFERLADWRTDPGGEVLASWMLQPAPPEEALARQQAVRELAPRVRLREELAGAGGYGEWPRTRFPVLPTWVGHGPLHSGATEDADAKVLRGPFPELTGPREETLRVAASLLLSAALVSTLGLFLAGTMGPTPFLLAVLLGAATGIFYRERLLDEEASARQAASEIAAIRRLSTVLAREEARSPRLRELRQELRQADRPLRGVLALERRLRYRRNLLFAPVAAALFWGTHHALALNRWRRRHAGNLRRWARKAGEFDALLALAQYLAERPGHVFPSFEEESGLDAVNLGHPLIPEARLQRNTVRLGRGEADVLIVTGSNMSGKSTLLRAIGTNFVLARMGAPVAATTFRLGPLALGVSISVRDSLRQGVSRFLAELLALRQVLETGSPGEPLLFLLDEILQGTNSNDRRLATGALLHELGKRSAIGVMTTHDLSLTELDHQFPGRVRNMHFTERMADGEMVFDYQLRDGILPRGNALELMRILGLPAPEDDAGEFSSLSAVSAGREH